MNQLDARSVVVGVNGSHRATDRSAAGQLVAALSRCPRPNRCRRYRVGTRREGRKRQRAGRCVPPPKM